MEHTPGPWSCYHEGTREVNDTFVHTFIVVTPNTVAHDNSIGVETSKLIAAAPDLLQALEDAIGSLELETDLYGFNRHQEAIDKAKTIVKRAKNG